MTETAPASPARPQHTMTATNTDTTAATRRNNRSDMNDAEHRLTDLIDRWKIGAYPAADLMPSVERMPAFLADVDAALRELRQTRTGLDGTMAERDRAQAAADKLAYAIAPVEVIGEHSSGNDPWAEALDVLRERPDLIRAALNAATAMNGVHERTIARLRGELEQAKLAPGPTGLARVWSGYDDDERWFPFFATAADAKAYAEADYRADCTRLGTDDPGEIGWTERAARTEDRGYPGMFDLETDEGREGWVLCEVLVHQDLASGLRAQPIETAEPESEAAEEYPGQGALPVEAEAVCGFRVGDRVQITGRGDIFDGKAGEVVKVDARAGYPIGLAVEGYIGPVWCNSDEIRHADAAQCPSCRGTGSHREPDPGDAEFESDRECLDCDGTGRVASAAPVETAGSAL